jgi:chloride channel 3/4/5
MNSRTSSFSVPTPRLQQRPSFSSRLSFAISSAEQGEATAAPTIAEHQIEEEIDEIKRYEVCLHIDLYLSLERSANLRGRTSLQ